MQNQNVIFKGSYSRSLLRDFLSGVSEGSVLGLALFRIYIRDISLVLEHDINSHFTDGTSPYIASRTTV